MNRKAGPGRPKGQQNYALEDRNQKKNERNRRYYNKMRMIKIMRGQKVTKVVAFEHILDKVPHVIKVAKIGDVEVSCAQM